MKIRRLYPYLALCAFLIFPATVMSGNADSEVAGTLSFMIGDVYVSSDGESWGEADFDMEVAAGSHIKTGEEALCEITLTDGTIIRMDENSIQVIERTVVDATSKKKSVFLSAGKVWVNARKILSKGDSFKVRTNKAVCAIRGTTFSVDEGAANTQVRVHEGKVATWSYLLGKKADKPDGPALLQPFVVKGPHPVSMDEWVEIIGALQQITIDPKGGYAKEDFDPKALAEDPWVAWNMQRDEQVPKK